MDEGEEKTSSEKRLGRSPMVLQKKKERVLFGKKEKTLVATGVAGERVSAQFGTLSRKRKQPFLKGRGFDERGMSSKEPDGTGKGDASYELGGEDERFLTCGKVLPGGKNRKGGKGGGSRQGKGSWRKENRAGGATQNVDGKRGCFSKEVKGKAWGQVWGFFWSRRKREKQGSGHRRPVDHNLKRSNVCVKFATQKGSP